MKKYFCLMAMAIAVVGFTACTSDNDDNPTSVVVTDDKPFPYDSEIDESVRPGDDFFRYALGGWLNSSDPAPSFSKQINENNKALLVKALTTCSAPLLQKLRGMVNEAMTDDSRSVALLRERLQMLEHVETADQMYDAFARLHELGYSPLFRIVPFTSDKGKTIIGVMLTGAKTTEMDTIMGRSDAQRLAETVTSYCQTLSLLDYTDERIAQIKENALNLLAKEMKIFPITLSLEFFKKPDPLTLAATRAGDENLAMKKLCRLMGIDESKMDIVYPMSQDILTLFASAEQQPELVPVIRDYMIYSVISQDAFCVPKLTGKTDRFSILNNLLHYSKYYKYRILTETLGYDNIYKQQCIDILENMRKTFIRRVENLDWMSAATKAEAKRKAKAMSFYVGYPDEWNDDMIPQADGDCLLAAATMIRQHEVQVSKQMIGGNYDELGWDFMASSRLFTTDNALHLRPANSLVILPSMVTKPRFDGELSEAALYAVATSFGHEFCHGFDAGGSLYDADGNAYDSWIPADRQAFEAKQQVLIDLFNQLEDYPGQAADGNLTLNENLADYGGLELALDCYKQRLREQGFTGEQFDEQIKKFFLSYVQIWKEESERSLEELKKLHDMKNSHSLNHVRVNGMMRLQDDWYRLYDVKPTDKLYLAPEQRVKIW